MFGKTAQVVLTLSAGAVAIASLCLGSVFAAVLVFRWVLL